MFIPASASLIIISTLLVLGPMVAMMEVYSISCCIFLRARTHLAKELLLVGRGVKAGGEASEPSDLRLRSGGHGGTVEIVSVEVKTRDVFGQR